MPYPFLRVKRSAAATERSPVRDPRMRHRGVRPEEEVIANPRRSARKRREDACLLVAAAWTLGGFELPVARDREAVSAVSWEQPFSTEGIGRRPGICCTLHVGSSFLQKLLDRRNGLIVSLSHRVFITSESV